MPVSPNAIPASGPVSVAMLHAEFGLGYNLNAYKGLHMYNTANNSRRDIGSGANAYVSMSDFRGYQATSPVVPGSRNYSSSTGDTLPLFNVITFTVWGGGGGGGGGAVMNFYWGKGADGNGGTGGGTSYVQYAGSNFVAAGGGNGGGGGIRNSTDNFDGANGSGADGAHGAYGDGGYGANDGTSGARAGGHGGYGGKSSITFNVDANSGYLSWQNQSIYINIGGGGKGGSGGSISQTIGYFTYEQHGGTGADGTAGYVTISWY